ALDQVIDVAEGASLGAVAVDGNGSAGEGLNAEVRDDAAVGGGGTRAVGVEDAGDSRVEPLLADVFGDEGVGVALAFVVAGARPGGVHVAPVGLGLGMDLGVAVDLGGGRL